VSINHEIVHGIPNENPVILKGGDIVSIDGLLKYKGLITDSCITVGVGTMSKESLRLIMAAQEARSAAIKAARLGGTTGDIGAAVQRITEKYGYASPHELGGHGVGLKVHEEPFIPNFDMAGEGELLTEGMVLAIEPILIDGKPRIKLGSDGYTYSTSDGSLSAQFEHTVLITKSGTEILTK
jgi:methionyl aminopeptidase